MPVTGWSERTTVCLPVQQSNMHFTSKIQIDLPRGKQGGVPTKILRFLQTHGSHDKTQCKPHRKSVFTEGASKTGWNTRARLKQIDI